VVAEKANEANGGACGGVCWSLLLGRVWSQAVGCVLAFGRNLVSFALKMFPHSIYFVKNCKCNFNAICKDNDEMNCPMLKPKIFISLNFHKS
jgi:hypothetical protein